MDCGQDARPEEWYALWTRSHAERLVHDQLAVRGFQLFLPTLSTWSRRRGTSHRIDVPMFRGYLFLRHAMDKATHNEVRKARGLVRILGDGWDRLAPVPAAEIDAVRMLLSADLCAEPYPFLRVGQRVRVVGGPLAGVEGLLVQTQPGQGRLVISVSLLQQSVAVNVDCADVAAL